MVRSTRDCGSMTENSDYLICQDFCASAPAKVIFGGTDALLTTSFWKGGGGVRDSGSSPPLGPIPRSNKDVGLVILNNNQTGPRFIMLTLKGWFKGKVDKGWHLIPLSNFTHSGLPFWLWMERALHQRVNVQGRTKR